MEDLCMDHDPMAEKDNIHMKYLILQRCHLQNGRYTLTSKSHTYHILQCCNVRLHEEDISNSMPTHSSNKHLVPNPTLSRPAAQEHHESDK